MPALTLAQRFGANYSFNATAKTLTISLADLSSILINSVDYGLNVSAMTDANKETYAARILWALLLKSQSSQAADNNDQTVAVYITNQGKRSIVRNNVSQFGYQLVATAYKNDTLGVNIDPDELAA